jgi:hypothetical protein
VSNTIGWARRLKVTADAKGLVGHAGAVLLRRCADQVGLTTGLSRALRVPGRSPGWDRGVVLVQLAVAICLGATAMADIAMLEHQAAVFGAAPSDSTVRRALAELDAKAFARIAKARARVRAHVWGLLAGREQGFPWIVTAGRAVTGWVVVDVDATLISAVSAKQGAAATYKRGFGFHPLGAWCANTGEALAMWLRPGNAGANTASDHIGVLTAAIAQIPASFRRRLIIRCDGAGASHELTEHVKTLGGSRRAVHFVVGWMVTASDEAAIAALPASAWTTAVEQDGEPQDEAHVAEITGLDGRVASWPAGTRLIVRRSRPSRRHERKLTDFEKATGWRYQITATSIDVLHTVPGSHHGWFLDALYRHRGAAEDQVRAGKAQGLRNLPSKMWHVNAAWMLGANIAADLTCWTRLLGLDGDPDLADAEVDTLRLRLWHLPGRLVRHARDTILRIPADWPWAEAFTTCWRRLAALPNPG